MEFRGFRFLKRLKAVAVISCWRLATTIQIQKSLGFSKQFSSLALVYLTY